MKYIRHHTNPGPGSVPSVAATEVIEENGLDALLREIEEAHREPGEKLYCAHCNEAVTTSKERTRINDNHQFEVVNPVGVNFTLGCFANAWGCGIHGEPEATDSWFPGYTWQYAYCLNCQDHLGWFYQHSTHGNADHFFGLIAEKLVERSNLH